MDKVTFMEIEINGEKQTHAIIEHSNGEFTSMTKAHYEAQLANEDQAI